MDEEKFRCWGCMRLTPTYMIDIIHCRCGEKSACFCDDCTLRLPYDNHRKYNIRPCCLNGVMTKSAHKK